MGTELWVLSVWVLMLARFRRLNEDIRVGSADVKALYPSLDIDFSINKVCEVFHASKVRVVGLNVEELGLYLALNRNEEELRAMEFATVFLTVQDHRRSSTHHLGCTLDENGDR